MEESPKKTSMDRASDEDRKNVLDSIKEKVDAGIEAYDKTKEKLKGLKDKYVSPYEERYKRSVQARRDAAKINAENRLRIAKEEAEIRRLRAEERRVDQQYSPPRPQAPFRSAFQEQIRTPMAAPNNNLSLLGGTYETPRNSQRRIPSERTPEPNRHFNMLVSERREQGFSGLRRESHTPSPLNLFGGSQLEMAPKKGKSKKGKYITIRVD